MTVGVHQPNYLPWLGYFYKIRQCDLFVFLDDVEYSKRSITRRVHIRRQKGETDKSYLTVPLKKHRDSALINELLIDHEQAWQKKQENQLINAYGKAPFFDELFPRFQYWMNRSSEFSLLSHFNQYLIRDITHQLWGEIDFRLSSQCAKASTDEDINLRLVRYLNGSSYLSGQGGKGYQNEAAFAEAGIQLQYLSSYSLLERKRYVQQQGSWLNGLSIIDALMNVGVNGVRQLLNELDAT